MARFVSSYENHTISTSGFTGSISAGGVLSIGIYFDASGLPLATDGVVIQVYDATADAWRTWRKPDGNLNAVSVSAERTAGGDAALSFDLGQGCPFDTIRFAVTTSTSDDTLKTPAAGIACTVYKFYQG